MQKIRHLILAIALLFASLSFAVTEPVITPEKQTKYILFLYHSLPEVFLNTGVGLYSAEPLEVMRKERRFLESFQAPAAQKIVRAELGKPDYKKMIQVQVQSPENVIASRISDSERENLWKQFGFLGGKYQTDAQINAEIVSLARSLKGQSFQGLLTGMIQSLPPELKVAAFKLPAEEKAHFVIQNITDQQLRTNFRSNVYTPDTISVHFLINELQRMKEVENHIATLSLFQEWKRKGASESAFDALPELKPMQNETGLSSLEKETGIDAKDAKRVKEVVQGLVQGYLKPHLQQSAKTVWASKNSFSIELLTPNLAVYRGGVNGDCFTGVAYGFAYSPRERTFLVRDEEGKALTAVYATEVMFQGKLSLYIHDMGSSSVSPTMGSLVFRAFDQIKSQLGYAHLVQGAKGMHHGNFQQDIRGASELTNFEPIQYLDAKSRELIGEILVQQAGNNYARGHDLPMYHETGRLFVPKSDLTDRLSVQVVPKVERANTSEDITPSERRVLVLQFLGRGQEALARAIVGPEHAGQMAPLKDLLLNTRKLPIQQYYESLRESMLAAGLGWDENTQKENGASFVKGHLEAPDAWQGLASPVSKVTAEYIASLLKANVRDTTARSFVQTHREVMQTPALEKLLRSTLKDNAVSMEKARFLLPYFRGQQLSPALLESLYQVFDFQNHRSTYGAVPELLATIPHTPTPEQMGRIQRMLVNGTDPYSAGAFLVMIAARPEMWQPALIKELTGLRHMGRQVEEVLTKYDEMQASKVRKCGSAHSRRDVAALSVFIEPIRSLFQQGPKVPMDPKSIFASDKRGLNLNLKNACYQ